MGPKRKQAKNGFFYFMIELKQKLESEGRRFSNLSDVQPVASPLWNNLPAEKKSYYNQIAKQQKNNGSDPEEKYDSLGVPLSHRLNEDEAKLRMKVNIHNEIEKLFAGLKERERIITHLFHFGYFNYAVETEEGEWYPCEVGLVKYSLKDGIVSTYHQFIEPGELRLGYSFAAKQHSEESHKIPLRFQLANSDYVSITDSIKQFLTVDGTIDPIYFILGDMPKAEYMLKWLVEKSCIKDPEYDETNVFRVYELNKLLYELRRYADINNPRLLFPSMNIVGQKLCTTDFDYAPNMACQWHEDEDLSKFCALAISRRYAYAISDLCCDYYSIDLIPDHHCPSNVGYGEESRQVPNIQVKRLPMVTDRDQPSQEPFPLRLPQTIGRTVGRVSIASRFNSGNGVSIARGRGLSNSETPREEPPRLGRGRGIQR